MNSLVTQMHLNHPDLWIEPRRLKGRNQVSTHYKSRLFNDENGGSIEVLLESKTYWSNRVEYSIRLELHPRLETITELLQQAGADYPNNCRVLDCIGCFYDVATFSCGLAYRLPTSTGMGDPNVSTLRSVLAEQQRPLLSSRFRLAQILSAAVLEFHKVGWLHRGISSLNVAFVYPIGSSWLKCMNDPYLLGFSNSQPDGPDPYFTWLHENDHALMDSQHPDYLQNKGRVRYRPEFDYYCWNDFNTTYASAYSGLVH